MIYAHIVNGGIVALGQPPLVEYDGARWWDLRDPAIRTARGWREVVTVPRPADTATTTSDYAVTLVGGIPTETWTVRAWTAAELAARAQQAVEAALADETRAAAQATLTVAQQQWAADHGRVDGQAWTQPTGAHDAYALDATVTHAGKTWTSLVASNVWQPPTMWREKVTGGGAPAWVQPVGAGDAYKIGDRVTFEGQTWESLINANVWSPTAYPAGWKLVP